MSRILYETKRKKFRSLTPGACYTNGWQSRLEWSASLRRLYERGGPARVALDELLRRHDRALPALMRAGEDISSRLEDEGDQLFPDDVYLMTSCGSHPDWESPRKERCRLHSLIAFPSSF